MEFYQNMLTGAALAVCAYTDLRYRKVFRRVTGLYFLLAAAGRLCCAGEGMTELLCGPLPGLFCLLLAWATRQALGYGDAFLLIVCGISLGFQGVILLSGGAFFLAGIWAMVLFCRKRDRKQQLPFVPFLLISMIFQTAAGLA